MESPRTQIWPTAGRTILALWVSPLVAPILHGLLGMLLEGISGGRIFDLRAFLSGVAVVSFYALPVSYAGMLILGLPSLVLLHVVGRLSFSWLVVVAAVEGMIVVLVFFSLFPEFSWAAAFQDGSAIPLLGRGAIMAAGVATAFWFISGHYTGVHRRSAGSVQRVAER